MDIKIKRIPNWWIGVFFLVGWIDAFFKGEIVAYISFSFIGFFICSLGFWIGAVGGGDVKLMAVLAGWIRSLNIWMYIFMAFVIAACIGVIQMICQRKFCSRIMAAFRYLITVLTGNANSWKEELPDAKPISFSICILIGYWMMRHVS